MSMDTGYEKNCKHGRVARVCDDCAHEKEIAELTAEKDKLAQHCSDVMAENEELRKKLDKFDSDSLERLSKALEALEHRSRQYLATIEGLRESNASCKNAIHLQNKRCEDLFKANEEQARKIVQLKAELEKEKARKHAAVDAFDKTARLCAAADGNNAIDQKVRDLLTKGHDVVGYVLRDNHEKTGIPAELCFIVGGRAEWFMESSWFDQMRQRGDQERKIIDLERHLEKQTKDYQDAQAALSVARKEAKDNKHIAEFNYAQYVNLEKALENVKRDKDALNSALDKIQPQIEDAQKKADEYSNMFNKERAAHEMCMMELKELLGEIEQLKNNDTFEQAAKFRDELKCANQKIRELQAEHERKTLEKHNFDARQCAKMREKANQRIKELEDAMRGALAGLSPSHASSRILRDALRAGDEAVPRIDMETFVPGLGTVRACLDCGCLVAGGPTRCKRCARECEPRATTEDTNERVNRQLLEDCLGQVQEERNQLRKELKELKEPKDSANGGLKHD